MKFLTQFNLDSTLNSKRVILPGVDGDTVAVINDVDIVFQPNPSITVDLALVLFYKFNATMVYQKAAYGGILDVRDDDHILQVQLGVGYWPRLTGSIITGDIKVLSKRITGKQVYRNDYYLVSTADIALGLDMFVEFDYDLKQLDDIQFITDNL